MFKVKSVTSNGKLETFDLETASLNVTVTRLLLLLQSYYVPAQLEICK